MRYCFALILASFLGLLPRTLSASDHADPALPAEFKPELAREPNLTGLFTFPEGDRLVLVLGTYASLSIDPPYELDRYEFVVYIDLDSAVDYSDAQMRARYGGRVIHPERISPEVTITIRLDNDGTLAEKTVTGLANPEAIQWYAGVRDDPFIFTPFFGRNVVAMVMSIPLTSFPPGQQDWVLWAISRHPGSDEIIDHVGRGLRTQLPRFAIINTLPPSEHVARIDKEARKSAGITDFIMEYVAPANNLWQYTFAIRYYDAAPDVSIYTTRFPPGYPNGRRLEDDIAAISCAFGECILSELAITVGKIWPRPAVNDKAFLPDFPYVAEPWPPKGPPATKKRWLSPQTTVKLVIGAIVVLFALNIFLLIRCWRRSRRA